MGLILSQPVFLLDFGFKNLDFSVTQLAHLNDCLTTLFVIITFLGPILSVRFLQLNNKFAWFYNDGKNETHFKHFDFIKWFDVNSNSDNSNSNDFLDD